MCVCWPAKPRSVTRLSDRWLWGFHSKAISTRLGAQKCNKVSASQPGKPNAEHVGARPRHAFRQISLWSRNNTSSAGAFHLSTHMARPLTRACLSKWPTIRLSAAQIEQCQKNRRKIQNTPKKIVRDRRRWCVTLWPALQTKVCSRESKGSFYL